MTQILDVELEGGVATAVGGGDVFGLTGLSLTSLFERIGTSAPGETVVCWWEKCVRSSLTDPARWPALLQHPMECRHLGLRAVPPRVLNLVQGFVGESPFVLPAAHDRPRICWLVSAQAGVATAAALGLGRSPSPAFDSSSGSAAAWGWEASRVGLFPYEDPRLLEEREPLRAPAAARWSRRDLARLARSGWGVSGASLLRLGRWLPARAGQPAVDLSRDSPGPPRAEASTIDVVVPTLERERELVDLLDDLSRQSLVPGRVFVVEQRPDGSASPLAAPLERRGDPFELVHEVLRRVGASHARNWAIERSDADYLAFLDDDVRLDRDFLSVMMVEIREAAVYGANAGVVEGGRRIGYRGGVPRPAEGLGSGRSVVLRRAIVAVGGFDPVIEGWGEDYELGFRLNVMGFPLLDSGRCALTHLKAPRGGFRAGPQLSPKPGRRPMLSPSPHPIVAYRWRRWLSPSMRRAACLAHFVRLARASRLYPLSLGLLPVSWLRWQESLRQVRAFAGTKGRP